MSHIRLTGLVCTVLFAVPYSTVAQQSITNGIASFESRDQLIDAHAMQAVEHFSRDEDFLSLSPPNPSRRSAPRSGATRGYLPVLYSALVPGAGEMALGHWVRGSLMLALEVVAWTGYAKYDGDGVDVRAQYEAFADEHWTIRKWIDDHKEVYPAFSDEGWQPEQMDSIGRVVSGSGTWPGYIPWVSKQEDKQHFYENIGKYDWYISGWDDYDPAATPQQMDTDHRDRYRDMRIESDDNFDTAKRFVYLSVATRVASVLQTVFLVRRHDAGDVAESRFGVRARAYGTSGGEVALEYRFK